MRFVGDERSYVTKRRDLGLRRILPLAANYLLKSLEANGCQGAYSEHHASREFTFIFAKQAKDSHVIALDIAKRLLNYNQQASTIYPPRC